MSSCVAVACWISEHPAIEIRIFNNNIANPVKWFSALACCSSGGCGPDPWVIVGGEDWFLQVVFCARFYRQNISYTIWGKNNGFPTTACFLLYIQVMYTINVQRWYTVGQSLENVMWKTILKIWLLLNTS